MTHAFREAIGDAHEQYDALVVHLALIRDLVQVGQHARSLDELMQRLAETLVTGLGHERVLVVVVRDGALAVAGDYTQTERFGDAAGPCPPALAALAAEVLRERALVRWGGEGVGARRSLPPTLEGCVVGFPLVIEQEYVGAVLCHQLVADPWTIIRQRALELVGQIVDQVVTLAHTRLTMGGIRRELEDELGTSRSRLSDQERTLRAQSEHIGELATALVASSRAKNTFLSLMSHELRTPLSVILGFGSMLRDGVAGPVTPQQSEYLDRIAANGRQLAQLVEDMLFFVDAQTSRVTPKASQVDLAELVAEVVAALPEAHRPDGPRLTVAIVPDARVLETDAALLRRILFHVVSNAFKFTEKGEVRIEAVPARALAGVEVRVIDTGCGISPEAQARIFELFSQIEDAHTRRHEGVGLGLSLVRAGVALLGGRCEVASGAVRGTRVTLTIPTARVTCAGAPQALPRAPRDADGAAEPGASPAAAVGSDGVGAEARGERARGPDGVSRTGAAASPSGRAGSGRG